MNPPRRFIRAAVTAAIAVALSAASLPAFATAPAGAEPLPASAPSPAAGSTTWTIEPSTAEGPDGRVSIRQVIEPGDSAQEHVTVTNFSAEPATFAVYASDGVISTDGNFDLLPPDEDPVDGGSWIEIATVEGSTARPGGGIHVEVAPAGSITIPLTISVPADATPGDHPAGVVAELVPEGGSAVQLASRVGVRVHLRAAGELAPGIGAEQITASWAPSWNPFAPGTVVVEYTLANEGNVRIGADSAVAVAGVFGLAGSATEQSVREVLPGKDAASRVELSTWPLFFGWGEVTVTPVVVGEDEVTAPAASSGSFTVWTVPWSQLALIALLVGLFFLVRALRARSRNRVQAKIDAAVAAAQVAAPAAAADSPSADSSGAAASDVEQPAEAVPR